MPEGKAPWPPGLSTSWRLTDQKPDYATIDLIDSPIVRGERGKAPIVCASAEIKFGGNWNFVAMLGIKMVEMAAQMAQAEQANEKKIEVAPADTLRLLK